MSQPTRYREIEVAGAPRELGRRLGEAARMGFRRALYPADNREGIEVPAGFAATPVATAREAIDACLGAGSER